MPPTHEVTRLLREWNGGDAHALERLLPVVYDELRRLAGGHLRKERAGHTLEPTALVHEAYLRLLAANPGLEDRRHFFGAASRAMRRILVDHARARHAAKRGGHAGRVPLETRLEPSAPAEPAVDLVLLDEALTRLAALDERQARIVELRYFAGLEIEAVAELLDISPATVKREWQIARAWLLRSLEDVGGAP